MKWFDSLFSDKKTHTSLKNRDDIGDNASKTSYRDIKKRNPILSLAGDIFDTKKRYTPFSFRRNIEHLCEAFPKYLSSLTHRHWFLIFVLLVFTYSIYAAGFIARTEKHIEAFRDNPGSLMTNEGFIRLRAMRGDYQILAPLIQNPFIPVEPLATYGRALNIAYNIVTDMDVLEDVETQIMEWREVSTTTSIFPIIEMIFSWISDIDDDVQSVFEMVRSQGDMDVELAHNFWINLQKYQDTWYTILGKKGPTRILLLNQNSDELRAGGGFPGTAFIIEFNAGQMTRFQFYDIYALDWHLRGYRPSPEGINRFRSIDYPGKSVEFEIRDANYYPRFRDSAVKLSELAQEAGIGKLDLVVGINQKMIEDIVRLVEPIHVSGVPVPIDHKNVTLVLSMLVEGKKTLTGTPKGTVKILSDALLSELQKQGKQQQAAFIFASHVYHGELVVGSGRADVQQALDALGIFDRWQWAKGDWVYPIFTSISRNKSDRLMERTFEINHTDRCERMLTLRQKHWFDLIEAARIRSLAQELGLTDKIKTLLPVQGGGDNVQYLRFILPPGTKLLKSDPDFSISDSNNVFTTVDGYETTSPGTTRSMTIRYVLPEGYCDARTEFFKQPGLRNTRVVIQKQGVNVYQKFYE